MSTVDDLLDFGSVGQAGNTNDTNTDDFGDIAWQPSSNTDLLAEFDMSTNKSEDKPLADFDFGDQAQEGGVNNTDSLLGESSNDLDDPFASVKLESSDNLLKDFGFESDLLSGGTSSNPFGEGNPFESNYLGGTKSPLEETTELDEQQEEKEERQDEKEEEVEMQEEHHTEVHDKGEADESDEDGGPQVSSAIDDQVYYQDSSSEEEQNFDTIRPFKPTPAKRPSTSAVTPETHEEEDETFGQHDIVEEEHEEEEDEEVADVAEEELVDVAEEEEEAEELQEEEKETAKESVNGAGHEDDSHVDAFLNARNQRFEDESSDRADEEHQDGSGFAYEGHVFGQEKLRDPSPELRESSRYVSDTTAAFDHHSEGGSDEMCRSCGKRVYQMERLIADKHVYHKMCFKCSKCRSILSIGKFAVNNGELYCKPHFMELFKYRGRYDDNPDAPSNNGYSPPAPVSEKQERRVVEEVPAGDVIREDDSVDDGIASGPRLSNLRSRFEVAESNEQPQREAPPRQTNRQWKYQQKDQQIQERESDEQMSSSNVGREEELPPQNMARNIAAKFREMESTDGAPIPKLSPRSERKQIEQMNQRPSAERSERSPSIGSPVSEHNVNEKELPPPDTTRSMAAIFRALESQGGPAPTPHSATRIQAKAREQSGANSTVRLPARDGRQFASEDMCESEPERSNGHSASAENEPLELDPNVIRNDDPAPEEELPERGTTRNLVAMFKSMEAK